MVDLPESTWPMTTMLMWVFSLPMVFRGGKGRATWGALARAGDAEQWLCGVMVGGQGTEP